ncbi:MULTISPECIES: hypothetical protein [Erythrobacter]|uniref:Uncharacterized protein n=1 Tax=Erythrobacter aureus TaxID=2182384 RepID=A0A345YGR2_9SPHN|nr:MULTISPECIES: hypothetical protein [Erythrobacter]AXK43114.1 hypothetical protein DVR09_12980 [Erythrobacter aureus]MBL43334.1 hypothetical protein [Sphingomonadaceae bacterium]MBQ95826.1 hypothetical protein [Actinomycetota bacterium]MCF8881946.1 hypothetical protein [Erythrobacter sp. SN021]|tara:strand:- start:682 stop:1158 length:477 start_codon:yes stop_codon:yes gene_type:complete
MSELLQIYWPLIVAALVLGVAIAWYVFNASRKTRVTGTSRDVLDEGAAPAERNKALIDSAPAATPMQPAVGAAIQPDASGDDLTRIKGLGPKLAATLRDLGVTTFAQIAAWDEAGIDRIDSQLGRFQGRIRRDDWVGQAQLLAQGDDAGFAERYGKLS